MIRRRALLIFWLLFAVTVLVLAYSGVESNRKNMLRLLVAEGESLLASLITSAENNVAASAIVEEATNERLLDIATLLANLTRSHRSYLDSLDVLERRYRLERLDLVDFQKKVVSSSWSEAVGRTIAEEDPGYPVLDTVLSGRKEIALSAPMPTVLPEEEFSHVAVRTSVGALYFTAPTKKLTDYQISLGIGFLVQQLGGEEGIDYVVLQSDSGIVLASRNVPPMSAIAADTFLASATTHQQIVNRMVELEGKEVLELVRSFRTTALPSGVLRLGLSLEGYNHLLRESLKQLLIFSLLLIVLGMVGSYAVMSLRRLKVATADLDTLKSVTDEIVESVRTAVVAVNKEGEITIFNPQAEKIFSFSSKAAVGQVYFSLFPDDLLLLDKLRTKVDSFQRREIVYSPSPERKLHLLISSSPILSTDRSFSGAVALVYDLTETRRLEESARTSERLSELGNLAAGVAHEIRNPLNSISIATQRILAEFQPINNKGEFDAMLRTISAEVERLNLIIRNFLALARGNKVEKVFVDMRSYVEDIVTLARLDAEEQKTTIKIDIDPGTRSSLDRMEMKKVVLNLLKNAVEAAGDGGTVTISARTIAAGKVDLRIANSGTPIPEDIRHRVFQPYFTTKPDGTGLGLAISHRIVADHGGILELMEGEPTTFRIVV